MRSPYALVLVTAPDGDAADKLASCLLEEKLAACVNQLPRVRSRYWWKGKIEEAQEVLLLIKSREALLPEIVQCVRESHPYEVPEVIALPITNGHKTYLDWIGANTLFKPLEDENRRKLRTPAPEV